jgi:(S)-2-hydroxyglutarate dehydrogenase
MYFKNEQSFRKHTHQELLRSIKYFNLKAAKLLVPNLRANDLQKSNKVGIRAQLVDKVKGTLKMGFIVRKK